MIEKPKYNSEDLELIKRWGVPSEQEFDTKRMAFTGNGKTRITALFLAKQRKKFLEIHGKSSNNSKDS